MSKKDGTVDLRIKRTQAAIKKSFFELVEEKGFEHISVKDITDGAMISRNTFYLHYADKYELLNKICDDLMRTLFFRVGKQLRRAQKSHFTPESVAAIISLGISAIDTDKDAYRVLFNGSNGDVLTEKLKPVISRVLDLFTDDIGGVDVFSREYIVSGVIGLIKYYVTNDVEDIEGKCLHFAELHLGKIIEFANEKRKNQV